MIDATGLVPPQTIIKAIELHRPAGRITGRARLWNNLWNDEYVWGYRMMARFNDETLPLPGESFRQIHQELGQKNSLCEGGLRIGGQEVDLKKLEVSPMHVKAQYDSLVPPDFGAAFGGSREFARQGRADAAGRPCQLGSGAGRGQADVAQARSLVGGTIRLNHLCDSNGARSTAGG